MATRRPVTVGAVLLVLAALVVVGMALPSSGLTAELSLESRLAGAEASRIGSITVPVLPVGVVLGLAMAAMGAWLAITRPSARVNMLLGVGLGLFVIAFLVWAARDDRLLVVDLLRTSLRAAVPLTLGALSGVVSERSGVVNIAIEGQFLFGAFTAVVVASASDNAYVGLLAGALGGVVIAWMLGVLSVKFDTNQIVAGVVLIVLATGVTAFLASQWLTSSPDMNSPAAFSAIELPVLASIPILGPILFDQTILVYLTLVVVMLLQWALHRTRWGLRLRAVGEHPKAADTVGINVAAIRWRAVLLGGLLAGIGGAFLSIDSTRGFQENMSGGAGFIALAAMLAGRYSPIGSFAASLLFGLSAGMASSLQGLDVGIPSQLLNTIPYVVTLVVVAGLIGRLRVPAASGTHYATE